LLSGENARLEKAVTPGTRICVSLDVAIFRSDMVSGPTLAVDVSRYLPSGDIAASSTFPESVTCVIVTFWKGMRGGRYTNASTP
jgi:hypothetical protein